MLNSKLQPLNSPIIILVRPQLAENIGAAARAMANFGLRELRLVAPRDGWPQERAFEVASSGDAILKNAKVFATTAEALADIHSAYATTARPRDMVKRVVSPEEMVREIGIENRDSKNKKEDSQFSIPNFRFSILFGPERTGLENDDLVLCDAIVTIPTTEHASLNVAQAVVVMGYVWWKYRPAEIQTCRKERSALLNVCTSTSPATKSELEGMFSQLESALEACNYFREENKRDGLWHSIRSLFVRNGLSSQEIQTLRGIIRALREPRGPVSRTRKAKLADSSFIP